jgi:hypothetical protein
MMPHFPRQLHPVLLWSWAAHLERFALRTALVYNAATV